MAISGGSDCVEPGWPAWLMGEGDDCQRRVVLSGQCFHAVVRIKGRGLLFEQNDMSYGQGLNKIIKIIIILGHVGVRVGPFFGQILPFCPWLPILSICMIILLFFFITLQAILTCYQLFHLAFNYNNYIIVFLDRIKYCMLMNLPFVSLSIQIFLLFYNFSQFW